MAKKKGINKNKIPRRLGKNNAMNKIRDIMSRGSSTKPPKKK